MQVTLDNLSGLERKLTVTVPSERFDATMKKKLQQLATKVKIPGFRAGKVPFDIVQQRYGESAQADVVEELIRETYIEALKEKQLNPIDLPKFTVTSKVTEPFSYDAIFEVYPEIKFGDFSQIEVEKPSAVLAQQDLDEVLEKLRKDRVTWQKITVPERKAQTGDRLLVDFTIKGLDDSAEPKAEKDVKFVLGDGSMWQDFEKPLYGVSEGEQPKYTIKFPDTHSEKEVVGKDAEFEVNVREICEPILPSLDDEFAKQFKVDNLAALRKQINDNLEKHLQKSLENLFKKAITDKLLDNMELEVPKILVEKELKRLERYWQERFRRQSQQKVPEFPRGDFENQAKRSVALGLLLGTVIKENNLNVTNDEVVAYIKKLAESYSDQQNVVDWYMKDENRLSEIRAVLLEEKAINHLASLFSVIEKQISYKEATK